jgi:dienelactone hydrolase
MARNQRKYALILSFFVAHIQIFAQQELYCVNSKLYHHVNERRREFYTNDPAHPWRELMVRVWYPADNHNSDTISDRQRYYPLLIFSHGLGEQFNGDSYATLCEKCVKAGYIVVSISHSYACKPVQFSDGRFTTHSWSKVARRYLSGQEMDTWEADIEYVLNQCLQQSDDEGSLLFNKIDRNKIGMFGHSYGGAAAVQMCRKDARIKAAINLDGPLRGSNAKVPFNKPLLFIMSSALPYTAATIKDATLADDLGWSYAMYAQEIPIINVFIQSMNGYAHKIIIDGIRHTTFSDEIFTQHTILDSFLMNPCEAQKIIGSYIVDFFDQQLKK